ncbi:hypothetical protein P12x_000049 [Tundrisphaera lichenicola]|uniref:hypothetical protein n=1 Tax=Tundrisphaera lichenicola TaxID=2029860 RepID=UPI003EBED04F
MMTRSTLALGLASTIIALGFPGPAQAQQRANFGQQVQQQLLNDVSSRITGQPNYSYPNQGYSRYQVQRPVYGQPGYQQPGMGYNQPGPWGYRQPQSNSYGRQAAQRYRLPNQYNGAAPGSTVSYGGANYVVNADRTMSPASLPQAVPAIQRYQIPSQFSGAAPGSTVTYGSRNYAINNDGTMSPLARGYAR